LQLESRLDAMDALLETIAAAAAEGGEAGAAVQLTLAVAPLRTALDANSSRLEEVRRAGERERERETAAVRRAGVHARVAARWTAGHELHLATRAQWFAEREEPLA
jgi:hypothetical protein